MCSIKSYNTGANLVTKGSSGGLLCHTTNAMEHALDETNREAFKKLRVSEVREFKEHTYKVQTQSRRLKQNLPDDEIIVHMDFLENYTCKSAEEFQSAYWNQSNITLHTVVAYYKSIDSDEI